jgi:hypothetical protein
MIPNTNTQSDLAFYVTGNVLLHYDQLPSNTMTIPITLNDLKSNWAFENIDDSTSDVDSDGDGILDNADECRTQRETFNGYLDSDGCPDGTPIASNPTSPTNTIPTDAEICTNNGRAWINNACIDEATANNLVNGNIKFQVDIKNNDNSHTAFQVADDPSPFPVSVPLALTGGVNGDNKRTAEFTIEPRFVNTNAQQHKLTTVTASNITIEPLITIVENSETKVYTLGKKPIQDFVKTNGGSISDNSVGLSLGNIVVKASDIENAVPLSVVGLDESSKIKVKFLVDGTIDLLVNDGTFNDVKGIDISGADFDIEGLKVIRGTPTTSGGEKTEITCDPAKEYLKSKSSGGFSCVPNGTTPAENASGMCTIGDTSVKCEICTDNASGIGGFPCTENYRIDYCSGTNDCGSPVENKTSKQVCEAGEGIWSGTNDSDGTCSTDNEASCPITVLSIPQIRDVCVVQPAEGVSVTGGNAGIQIGSTNISQTNIILVLAGIGVLGIIIAIFKKKKPQYMTLNG